MSKPVQEARKYEPNKGYKPLTDYAPKYGKAVHVGEALGKTKKLLNIHDVSSELQLKASARLKGKAGKDYVGKLGAEEIDDIANDFRDFVSDETLNKYFKTKAASGELKEFITHQLIQPLEQLKRRLDSGERVNYQEIDQMVRENIGQMRQRLSDPIYTELSQHDKKEVAQEVASMMHYYVGGPKAEQSVGKLDRHKRASDVVTELMGLDREVSLQYEDLKRGSKQDEKGGKVASRSAGGGKKATVGEPEEKAA